ncbi:MAG: hypothetical protein WBK28_03465 [Minisyncoccia bacterium]
MTNPLDKILSSALVPAGQSGPEIALEAHEQSPHEILQRFANVLARLEAGGGEISQEKRGVMTPFLDGAKGMVDSLIKRAGSGVASAQRVVDILSTHAPETVGQMARRMTGASAAVIEAEKGGVGGALAGMGHKMWGNIMNGLTAAVAKHQTEKFKRVGRMQSLVILASVIEKVLTEHEATEAQAA